MLDKMKALLDMQKKIQEAKKELDSTYFEIKSSSGSISIVMNGSQEIKEVKLTEDFNKTEKTALQQELKDVFSRSIKRSQEIAAQKMKDVTGLNLPGK